MIYYSDSQLLGKGSTSKGVHVSHFEEIFVETGI